MTNTIHEGTQKRSGFISDLAEAARRNPLAATLIGMGLLWMSTGDRTRKRAKRSIRDRLPAADDTFEGVRSAARSKAETIGERPASAADSLEGGATTAMSGASRFGREQAARSIPEASSQMFHAAQSSLAELFRAQPLAIGVVGLAIGAAVAASLPSTDMESASLGNTSDMVKEKAADFAEEQINRAAEFGKNVVDAGAEEAHRQGLTPQDTRSAAATIWQKLGRVVESAGQGISKKIT